MSDKPVGTSAITKLTQKQAAVNKDLQRQINSIPSAQEAIALANTALANAATADAKAVSADAKAVSAQTKADSAYTLASSHSTAITTLQNNVTTVTGIANNANSTANAASTTATTAKNTADNAISQVQGLDNSVSIINNDISTINGNDSGKSMRQVAEEVKGDVYIPKGTKTFNNIPTLANVSVGWVYNISDAFTTDNRFIEGAGKVCPAGTNIVCITQGNTKYWDTLGFMIDLSGYQQKQLNNPIHNKNTVEEAIAASLSSITCDNETMLIQ